jgi:phenylacetate-CoA ligase
LSIDFRVRDFAYPVGLLRLRRFFEKSQWLPPEELRAYQQERLRNIIRQAYHHVPYYRRLFDEKRLKPGDIRTVEDLSQLPLLSREDVRRSYRQLSADNARRFHPAQARTSGTTGTPLQFLVDKPSNILEFVYYWRHWSWAGYRLGHRFADVRYDYFVRREKTADDVWAFQPCLGRLLLNSMRISPDRIGEYAHALRRYQPQFIRGRPVSLYCLAMFLRQRGFSDVTFQAVFTGGETVLPQHREMVENAFGCKILDSYGHMERCVAISQCPQGGFHVHSDYGILELAEGTKRDDGAVIGRVVGTSLHKMAMPFLRYQLDDLIELCQNDNPCPCGRTLPLVKAVRGRKQDVILTPDGRRIPSLFNVFHRVQSIRFFQLVQQDVRHLTVRIVKGTDYTLQSEDSLKFWLRRFIGHGMKIKLEYISECDLIVDDTGRLIPVVSHVPLW